VGRGETPALAEMRPPWTHLRLFALRFTPNSRMLLAGDFRVLSLFEDLGKPEEKLRNNVPSGWC